MALPFAVALIRKLRCLHMLLSCTSTGLRRGAPAEIEDTPSISTVLTNAHGLRTTSHVYP